MVVLWSKHSVDSRWVRSEATQADRYGTLVPVMIEACDRPILFELAHTLDLSGWNGEPADARWQALLASVRRLVVKGATSSVAALAAPAKALPRNSVRTGITPRAAGPVRLGRRGRCDRDPRRGHGRFPVARQARRDGPRSCASP